MDDRFYITGGTLPLDADSYVTRRADAELFEYLRRGEFCYVLNTRQVGKSSLMVRVAQSLRSEGVRVVLLDPTAIGVNVTVEEWYDGLLTIIAEQLSLRRELEDFWLEHPRLGPMQRWMQALEHVALAGSPEPLCIFVDEIDSVQSLPFSADEFFGGIRECYNRRAYNPAFRRLTFCLLGVAAPVDLIADARITPFNIGRRIELTDFTPEEAAPLANGLNHENRKGEKEKRRKGEGEIKETRKIRGARRQEDAIPLSSVSFSPFLLFSFSAPLNRVLYWTGGHPYLTQKLCSALARREGVPTNADVDAVCDELFLSRRGQKTDDNLAFARSRLLYEENHRAALLDVYQRILNGRKIRDDATNPLHSVLRLSGIAQAEEGLLTVRNRIYAHVFNKQWARDNMPGEELRRQRAAYRRGVARAAGVGSIVALAIGGLAGVALKQAQNARRAERKATTLQRNAVERLSRSFVNTGMSLLEQGDAGGALASLAEAMKLDAKDGERMRMHRLRFASALALTPRLKHIWFADKPLRWGALSPNRQWAAAGGEDGRVRIWNMDTGAELAVDIHHDGAIGYAAFSPDGTRLVTCGNDARARVWDLNQRRLLCTLKHPRNEDGRSEVIHASWSRDGKRIATGFWSLFVVWDVSAAGASKAVDTAKNGVQADNGAKIVLNNTDFVGAGPNEAVLSPDGERLAEVSGNYKGWMEDVARKQMRFYLGNKAIGGCYCGFHATFSADGRKLLVAGAFGSQAHMLGVAVLDAQGNFGMKPGKLLCPFLTHQGLARYAAFSPDEKRIVTAGDDRTACVWDAVTGKPLTPPMLHEAGVTQAEFSPDGSRIVTASEDRTARVWDAATGKPLCAPLRHAGAVVAAQFGANANQIFTVSRDGTARVWTLPPAVLPSTQIADSGCGIHLFVNAGKMLVWTYKAYVHRVHIVNTADGKRAYPADDQNPMFTDASWSADEQRIAFCGGGKAQVWAIAQGRPITPIFPTSQAFLSHNGHWLLLRYSDNQTRLVDVDTGQIVRQFVNTLPVDAHFGDFSLFAPDSRRIVVSDKRNRLFLLDTRTGRAVSPPMPHDAAVTAVRFSPDSRYLFTWATSETMRVWNVADGSPAYPPLHHLNFKIDTPLSFTGDGRYANTEFKGRWSQWKLDGSSPLVVRPFTCLFLPLSSPDGSLMAAPRQEDWLWDAATLTNRTPALDRNVKLKYAAFSPDSRKMLAIRVDGAARLWDIRGGQALASLLTDDQQIIFGAFSRDGKQMATGGNNGSIRLWDAQTGEALAPRLRMSGGVEGLEFTQEGQLVANSTQEGRIWNLPKETEALPLMEARALLLSGQRIDPEIGALPADTTALRAAWQRIQPHH